MQLMQRMDRGPKREPRKSEVDRYHPLPAFFFALFNVRRDGLKALRNTVLREYCFLEHI